METEVEATEMTMVGVVEKCDSLYKYMSSIRQYIQLYNQM